MIKELRYIFVFIAIITLSFACEKEETREEYNNPKRNFDTLWQTLDERYCFFELKFKEKSAWNDIYKQYSSRVKNDMSQQELFELMNEMIYQLRDGHVNISTKFDYARNWSWKNKYPETGKERNKLNLNTNIIENYLGENYSIAGGLRYKIIDNHNHKEDSIAYIRLSSFSSGFSRDNINAAFLRMKKAHGLIIDIRGNGGGSLALSDLLASHLYSTKIHDNDKGRLIGYIRHKVGKAHNDFSEPLAMYLSTISKGVRWNKPTVILINGDVYSAANDFIMKTKGLPWITIIGDNTGGGSGLPMSSDLPNGWKIRYSASRMTDRGDKDVEFGIAPDIRLDMRKDDILAEKDTYIEYSIKYLDSIYKKINKDKQRHNLLE